MIVRTLQRAAVEGSVRLARLPADAAMRLVPGLSDTTRNRIAIRVDRMDAGARRMAGTVLADDRLRNDAARRSAAADHREDAMELRSVADDIDQQATETYRKRTRTAAERMAEVDDRAEDKAARTENARRSAQRRVERVERERKTASRKATAAVSRQVDQAAKRERLDVLDKQAKALEAETTAHTARQEAQRLRRASAKAKSTRKSTKKSA